MHRLNIQTFYLQPHPKKTTDKEVRRTVKILFTTSASIPLLTVAFQVKLD